MTRELGILAPAGLVGVHLQQIFVFPSGAPGEMDKLTPFERDGFANLDKYQKYAGYQPIQQKRPATLGFGLVDSPPANSPGMPNCSLASRARACSLSTATAT